MANWILVPCLAKLRDEVNTIAPNRDKASDGTIGDPAHQAETSDHNDDEAGRVPIHDADSNHEVHAWDADTDLRESDLTMERIVQHILARCRSGAETRLRYVIYNRRIWSASTGWVRRGYAGPSAHTEHAHFSASYTTSLEASTASWRLEDIPVALTAGDKTWLTTMVDARADAIQANVLAKLPAAVLNTKVGDAVNAARTVGDVLRDAAKLRGVLVGDAADTKNAALNPTSPLAEMIAAAKLPTES